MLVCLIGKFCSNKTTIINDFEVLDKKLVRMVVTLLVFSVSINSKKSNSLFSVRHTTTNRGKNSKE